MNISRRRLLVSAAAIIVCPPFRLNAAPKSITPEHFGAVGDGVTNDTAAFAAMATFVNRRGGGVIELRPTTYIVGSQTQTSSDSLYSFRPSPIMEFSDCAKELVILGNGARLRCADGLRFGTFNATTGQATDRPMPNYLRGEVASPYLTMIRVRNCSGGVTISNIELDGNVTAHVIGGRFGDVGWQIQSTGLRLTDNRCAEHITQVYSHHHALDGLLIDGSADRSASSLIQDVICEYNGRQGCSIVGGRNYEFVNCHFKHTGKAGLSSGPGAGVDIEAGVSQIRDLKFSGCEFSNNSGAGLLADTGDSEGATFVGCRFVGSTMWAAWPKKPHFRFHTCEFVGSICNAYGDPDPNRAAQFHDCLFRDDPALSPTGAVYRSDFPIANLNTYENMLFNRCRFELIENKVLPWSSAARYHDCTMSQVSSRTAYPRGTYTGVNVIDGSVFLGQSAILGDVIVNGQLVARTG